MPNTGSRILYIDDEVGLCTLAKRRLERLGFDVTVAFNGADGLALARVHAFDLVALDHYMPGADGIETLGELMQLPNVPAVVYVTGSDETHIAVTALKAGATDYMVKTANEDFFDLLGRTIGQALDTRRIVAEKERAERHLRETNAQLEAMLTEMNHRVANSLQIVSSLVKLQERRTHNPESKSIMRDIRQRIDAVSRVHHQLYLGGGGAMIAMPDYIAGLADNLALTFANSVANRPIQVTTDAIDLPASDAVSLGIVINELASNACKYAYPEDADGAVRIILKNLGDTGFCLTVEDDGRGIDGAIHGSASASGTGLGTQIIRAMTETLGASLTQANTGHGFRTIIERAPN